VHVVLCRSPRPRLIGRALASSADCPGALRPWPGGWPLPAAGGRRHHCGRRPTKPVFCSQSEDKAKRTLVGTASLRLLLRSARRRPPPNSLPLPPEIDGLCPRFPG